MLPLSIRVAGTYVEIWDLALVAGLFIGYPVLRRAFAAAGTASDPPDSADTLPRALGLRYLVVCYVAILFAQLFSYAFDHGTKLLPPHGVNAAFYYLSPVAGPKTLYGAVVALPLAVAVAFGPNVRSRTGGVLGLCDRFAPALFVVLGAARIGCFLQGCCYGVVTERFGLRFAAGSVVYNEHVARGLIARGEPALAVLPTQLISAVVLVALSLWCYRRIHDGRAHTFLHGVALYSAFRFSIEWVRDDPARNELWVLSTSQWIAVCVLAVYVAWRVYNARHRFAVQSA